MGHGKEADVRGSARGLKFYYHEQRHLVCLPYSIENLHHMAELLVINRCWYHRSAYPHYDVPKRRMPSMGAVAVKVAPKTILHIIRHGRLLDDGTAN